MFFITDSEISKTDKEKLIPSFRVAAFLFPNKKGENIRSLTDKEKLVPNHIDSSLLQKIKSKEIEEIIDNVDENRKTYNTLCYVFIHRILLKDGWKIVHTDITCFKDNIFGIPLEDPEIQDGSGAAFIAQRKDRKIYFYFDPQRIKINNGGDFKDICVLILRTEEEMDKIRQVKNADKYPGVFFICFKQIRKKCEEIDKKYYSKLCGPVPILNSNAKKVTEIASVKARIIENIPVGVGDREPNHFKIRFSAPELPHIIPGQFIMMDTRINKFFSKNIPVKIDRISSKIKLTPESFLKRPFGIHRAFYKNFPQDYLRNLFLPENLATIMHTVYPDEFDIFYKVLENGVGTNELKKLKKGDRIQIIGPLGRKYDLRKLRGEGWEEIHVVGGGVGMAPLIFLVQALRFFNFKIKAFIGIESLEMLKHGDALFRGFVEDPADVKLYIDDLQAIGITKNDLFISCDKPGKSDKIISPKNYYNGLVSGQYKEYLSKKRGQKKF